MIMLHFHTQRGFSGSKCTPCYGVLLKRIALIFYLKEHRHIKTEGWTLEPRNRGVTGVRPSTVLEKMSPFGIIYCAGRHPQQIVLYQPHVTVPFETGLRAVMSRG